MENLNNPHYANGQHPGVHGAGPASSATSTMTHAQRLERLERIADWMDSRFILPGTDIRFGLDSIIGLLPGIGDTVAAGIAAYIIAESRHLGAGRALRLRMAGNLVIDWLVGSIPVFGDIFDIGFKANRRNLRLLREHLTRKGLAT